LRCHESDDSALVKRQRLSSDEQSKAGNVIKLPRPDSIGIAASKNIFSIEGEIKTIGEYSSTQLASYVNESNIHLLRRLVVLSVPSITGLFHRILSNANPGQLKELVSDCPAKELSETFGHLEINQQFAVYHAMDLEQAGRIVPLMGPKELEAWAEYVMISSSSEINPASLALVVPLFNISQILFLIKNYNASLMAEMIPHISSDKLDEIFDTLSDTQIFQKAFYALTGAQKKDIISRIDLPSLAGSKTKHLSNLLIAAAITTPSLTQLVLERIEIFSLPRLLVCFALGNPETLTTFIDRLKTSVLSRVMPHLSQSQAGLVFFSKKERLADLLVLVATTLPVNIAQCLNQVSNDQFIELVQSLSDEQLYAVAAVKDDGSCHVREFLHNQLFNHRNLLVLDALRSISPSETTTLPEYFRTSAAPSHEFINHLDRIALIFAMGSQKMRVDILKCGSHLEIDKLELIAPLLDFEELSEIMCHLNVDGRKAIMSNCLMSRLAFDSKTDKMLKDHLRMSTASLNYLKEDIDTYLRDLEVIQKEIAELELPGVLSAATRSK